MIAYLLENKYNILLGLFLLSVIVIISWAAFFRKIEVVNEQQDSDSIMEDLTHGIDEEMYN